MAIAVVGAACLVFVILGLLVYRAVATSTATQFDELLQQQAADVIMPDVPKQKLQAFIGREDFR